MLRLAMVALASLGVGCVYGLTELGSGAGAGTDTATTGPTQGSDDTGEWVTFDTDDPTSGTSEGTHKPSIDAFTATEETATVRFNMTVSDADQDMDDGWVSIEVDGVSRTYRWPQDLTVTSDTQASVTWALDEFQPEMTETVRLSVEDSTGRTDADSTSFTRATVVNTASENGDDLGDAVQLGQIPIPSEVEGTIYGCGNAGGSYASDTDMVKFTVDTSRRYQFTLTWTDGGISDLDLYLLNTSNQELNRAASVYYPEQLGHELTAGTTYQLFVGCWTGNPGTWNVRITVL